MTALRVLPWARVHTSAALIVLAVVTGCTLSGPRADPPSPPASPAASSPAAVAAPTATTPPSGSIVLVGRIVTMDEPPIAEALFIEDGTVVAVGTRDEVLARAGDQVPVIDIGQNVAYPGFIDAHAHWIGDREYYGIESPAEAMDAAASRGWTSISEQWVNPERLDELEAPGRRRCPAAARRRLPRPELRRRVPRRLVRRRASPAPSTTTSASRG